MSYFQWDKVEKLLRGCNPRQVSGKVERIAGLIIEGTLPGAEIGSLCQIRREENQPGILAEIVGLKDDSVLLMPFQHLKGLSSQALIVPDRTGAMVRVGEELLGQVIDTFGQPLSGQLAFKHHEYYPLLPAPINAMERRNIENPLDVGVKSINAFITCGIGQKLIITASPGLGKSVLLGMIARHTTADIVVVALIGERGREVKEFIESDLGAAGLKKSVVVVATGDESAVLRLRAAYSATTIAEYFRDKGLNVLLLLDSLTRVAMAQREIGLSIGEPPATKGYPPSAITILPLLMERTGMTMKGSITAFYTVLADDESMDDPVTHAARSISDGHIVLSKKFAQKGHFPAIDISRSLSRVMSRIVKEEHRQLGSAGRKILADYAAVADLVDIGAYKKGSNKDYDRALALIEPVNTFLKQRAEEPFPLAQCVDLLKNILKEKDGSK